MKIGNRFIVLLFSLLLGAVIFSAPVDPSWYIVDFHQEFDTEDNSIDFQELNEDILLGTIQIFPGQYYTDLNGAGWNGNFTIVITSPLGTFELVRIGDDTTSWPMTVNVVESDGTELATGLTLSPAMVPSPQAWNETPLIQFILDVEAFPGKPPKYRGSYYSVLRIEAYVDYGTDDEVRLGDDLYSITSHFVQPVQDTGGGTEPTIQTDLLLEQYPAALNVDLPWLQTTGGLIKVGAVNFFSDDQDPLSSYRIRISPATDPSGHYAFFKTTNPNMFIPYKLSVIPTRDMIDDMGTAVYGSQSQAFSVLVNELVTGFWQDYFELGVTQINYSDESYTTGEYTSEIRVELIRN